MLIIKVDLHPYGDSSRQKTLAELHISNDGTGDDFYGNYSYTIWDGEQSALMGQGTIEGHARYRHVWNLVKACLDDYYSNVEEDNKNFRK